MNDQEESQFTASVVELFEPDLIAEGKNIIDAEGIVVARCLNDKTADVLCRLLNFAIGKYPFRHPDDPSIVRTGFFE